MEVIFGDNVDKVREGVDNIGGTFENLGYGYGIITLPVDNLQAINQVPGIQYLELSKVLYTSDASSMRAACVTGLWQSTNLTGAGVLVGFIDTGIDYTLRAFRTEEGESRIEFLYDLAAGGLVYTKAQIDEALASTDPYSVVDFRDSTGHGTHVAGIACAGGDIDRENYGAAYRSSIAMVKITGVEGVNFSLSSQIMRGIKFLIDRGREINQPLVINLSWSTNDGAHNGSSILEQYINTISGVERVTFVIAAGNEGDRAHHAGGELGEEENIQIRVSSGEAGVILQLYKPILSDLTLEITNPLGNRTGVIPVRQGYREIPIGNDIVLLYDTGPKPFNLEGEVIITILSRENTVAAGQWNVRLINTGEIGGRYDIWLPISENIRAGTRFLQPDVYNTLGIPATVENVISVGSYNSMTNSISSFSGRGIYGEGFIKPDIVAPGEGIVSTLPGGSFGPKTGTSMAAPHVSGICALLMEWGIVQGNDAFLYGDRLKYYLITGARRRRAEEDYPNPTWGYGTVCALDSFNNIVGAAATAGGLQRQELGSPGENYISTDYRNFIIQYQGDVVNDVASTGLGTAFIIDNKYAIISVLNGRLQDLLNRTTTIVYVEPPRIFVLNQVNPLEAANILQFHDNPYLTLTGRGVLLGIIDTGIDYMNTEFTYENNKTKILKIWDQTIENENPSEELIFGTEYTEEDINRAIALGAEGGDPYTIVPSRDTNGHGTHMAGIMGARGKDSQLTGAAPDARFLVVKLKQSNLSAQYPAFTETGEVPIYSDTDILMALMYLFRQATELRTPISVLVPLSTNFGPHDGSLIIEKYIDEMVSYAGVSVTAPCGNEGFSDTHTEGIIKETGATEVIELRIGDGEVNIAFEIWLQRPDKVSLGITSPSGEVIERIPARAGETEDIRFLYERTRVIVQYILPDPATGDESIGIIMLGLVPGIWRFTLYGDVIINGRYNAWIPSRILLKEGTRFLNPSQYITLTAPSTSAGAISVGFYNQTTNVMVAASGRGFTRRGAIKPDLVAGGVNAITTAVGGGSTTVSGSSVAGAVTAGAVALMLQWKIVEERDISFYNEMIKSYLIAGADKKKGEIYPNREWGYGTLNLEGAFESIRNTRSDLEMRGLMAEPDANESHGGLEGSEYTIGSLYIRIPSNFF